MKFRRELLQEKTGMKIDQPSSEGGTTSTGNIASRAETNIRNVTIEPFSKRTNIRIFVRSDD